MITFRTLLTVGALMLAACRAAAPAPPLDTPPPPFNVSPTSFEARTRLLQGRSGYLVVAEITWQEASHPAARRGQGTLGWRRAPSGEDLYFWTPRGQKQPAGKMQVRGSAVYLHNAAAKTGHIAATPLLAAYQVSGAALDPQQAMAWMLGVPALPELAHPHRPIAYSSARAVLDKQGNLAGFDQGKWKVRYQVWSPAGQATSGVLFPRKWTLTDGTWHATVSVTALQLPVLPPGWP